MNFNESTGRPQTSPPPSSEEKHYRRELRRLGNGVGFGFVALTASSFLIQTLVPYLVRLFPSIQHWFFIFYEKDGQRMYRATEGYSLALYCFSFLVAILVVKAINQTPTRVAFPLKKVPFDIMIAAVFICLASIKAGIYMTNGLASLLDSVIGMTPTMPDFGTPETVIESILHFINMAVAAALFEEFLCRGVVLHSLRPFGDNFALIVSSIAFGLMHGNLAQAPYAIVVGLVMGYFVLYTGSLWPAMIAHFINNGMSTVQTLLSPRITVERSMMISSIISIVYVIGGILGIVYLRRKYGSLFAVKRNGPPMKTKDKYLVFFSSVGMILFLLIEGYYIVLNLLGQW